MNKNRKQLISLMQNSNVNCIDVSKILDVKPNTVRVWRSINGASIPNKTLELLVYKLEKANVKNI